jgi:hypothetical protein
MGKIRSVRVFVASDDIESMLYAASLLGGFPPETTVRMVTIPKIPVLPGLWLFTNTMAAAEAEPLLGALTAVGVECKQMPLDTLREALHIALPSTLEADFSLYVGPKGPVYSQPK